ncbi:MAG TPA: hypothetical protein DCM32_00235 [Xanthomonadaceae bacterium]|jgi:crossover junction endodeoxyribonuclease RusA|nr:hypothetical protein [Xanthomonadaceae bacterium]
MTLSLSLPFPPSANNLFRNAGKKRVSTGAALAYAKAVAQHVEALGDPKAPAGELRAVIAVWAPDLRRRDLVNLEKAPIDGLVKAGVMADDSLIVDFRIYRAGLDRQNPRITVWMEAA